MAIKPSGVAYDTLKADDIVLVDLEGNVVEGWLNPSSDTPTHVAIYKAFPDVGGVAHAHSPYATMFAQARREIPALGTTHADFCHGPVPCTRPLTDREIQADYEANTGAAIVRRLNGNCTEAPGILVAGHGPFCWGKTAEEAAHQAAILEELARRGQSFRFHTPNGLHAAFITPEVARCLKQANFATLRLVEGAELDIVGLPTAEAYARAVIRAVLTQESGDPTSAGST